jgi:Arc/MetJ family transcription regulator
MVTTIQLDDSLFAKIQQQAEKSHRSVSEVVELALRDQFGVGSSANSARQADARFVDRLHPEVRRMLGIVGTDLDARAVYLEHELSHHT